MVDFTGTWKNQHGSTLELRELAGGNIDGRFESGVGDDGQMLYVDISGQSLGDIITFHAVYSDYRTIITWAGQHSEEAGIGKIKTHWLHVSDIPDAQERDWMWFTNRIGSDEFQRA